MPDYGYRRDGSPKGPGWLGEIALPKGGVATEYTVGTEIGGKKMDIPMLIPGLSKKELQDLISVIDSGSDIPDTLFQKAKAHAVSKVEQGESVFYKEPSIIDNLMNLLKGL
jgi:hypothetical protein